MLVPSLTVRSVRLELVIADGKAQRVDRPGLLQPNDDILRHPRLPVGTQLPIRLLPTQDLAEGVRVEADLPLILAEELVKERGGDPRFQHHPTPQIRAADLVVERQRVTVLEARHGLVHGNEMGELRPTLRDCGRGGGGSRRFLDEGRGRHDGGEHELRRVDDSHDDDGKWVVMMTIREYAASA
jgi:hypothetical protein